MITETYQCYRAWTQDLPDHFLSLTNPSAYAYQITVSAHQVYVWFEPCWASWFLLKWPQFRRYSEGDLV